MSPGAINSPAPLLAESVGRVGFRGQTKPLGKKIAGAGRWKSDLCVNGKA